MLCLFGWLHHRTERGRGNYLQDVVDRAVFVGVGSCISVIPLTTVSAAAIRLKLVLGRTTSCFAAEAAASCWIARLITPSREVAIRVAEHFFTVGELPRSLRWLTD
jgi:hypothetical protein